MTNKAIIRGMDRQLRRLFPCRLTTKWLSVLLPNTNTMVSYIYIHLPNWFPGGIGVVLGYGAPPLATLWLTSGAPKQTSTRPPSCVLGVSRTYSTTIPPRSWSSGKPCSHVSAIQYGFGFLPFPRLADNTYLIMRCKWAYSDEKIGLEIGGMAI